MKKPFASQNSFREACRHFTPNWFAINMGTGITAACLANFPGHPLFLYHLGSYLWMLDVLLFGLFSVMWGCSITLFPRQQRHNLEHPVSPLFLGCPPMALATVLNGCLVFGVPWLGETSVHIAQVLWWIDVALALAVVWLVPYYMFTAHRHELANMTAVWLLPFVACEVAAASGGLLMPHLATAPALIVLSVSYFLWGISLPLALTILVIYFQRLVIHKLPGKELAATMWLPLGPTGTGALSLLTLSQGAKAALLHTDLTPAWQSLLLMAANMNIVGAWIFIGLASWWAGTALILTIHYVRSGIPFNLSFWSYTFPLGVYTAAILNMSHLTGWLGLEIYGGLLTTALSILWLFVFYRTWPGLYSGHLIKNPAVVNP